MPAVPCGSFPAAHSRAEVGIFGFLIDPTRRGAVVGHEDQQGVFREPEFGEFFAETSEVLIDIGDHAVEFCHFIRQARMAIGLGIGIRHDVRRVWGVGGEIEKERFLAFFLNVTRCFVEPYIGAISFVLFPCAVGEIGIVVIVVSPVIRAVSNTAAEVLDHMLKPLILRSAGVVVSQMPLAYHRCGVAVGFENFRHGQLARVHQ